MLVSSTAAMVPATLAARPIEIDAGAPARSRLLRQQARIAPDRSGVYGHDLLQGKTAQIVRSAGLWPGAGQAGAAERLGADHRPDDVTIDIDIPDREARDDVADRGVDPGLNAERKPIAAGRDVAEKTIKFVSSIANHMEHGTEDFLPQIGCTFEFDNGG